MYLEKLETFKTLHSEINIFVQTQELGNNLE
jgi:hypothetical protein